MEKNKRIEYIDAMRGFTMLLVVMAHVSNFVLGAYFSDVFCFSRLFGQFRMPLFFFISGFFVYKPGIIWTISRSANFLSKKIVVQIVSPCIFMIAFLVCQNRSVSEALYDVNKSGYWFTFTLYEFYVLYIMLNLLFNVLPTILRRYQDALLLFFSLLIYYLLSNYSLVVQYSLNLGLGALLGVPTWTYFLFFCIGSIIRKYFTHFERLLDSQFFVPVCVLLYIWLNVLPELENVSSTACHLVLPVAGLFVVFALFRKKKKVFSRSHKIGRILIYIGRRTLDIYLIHYFFVFTNMQNVFPNFAELNVPFLEFILSFLIAWLIVIACLAVSEVLRISPLLAHYLFGQKILDNNK